MNLDKTISRVQYLIKQQTDILLEYCWSLLEDLSPNEMAVLNHKAQEYETAVKALEAILTDACEKDLAIIDVMRNRAVDRYLWLLCALTTALHANGVVPHKDDLFQRDVVKLLERLFTRLGSLLSRKYSWLGPIDVAAHLAARDRILVLLNSDHTAEWK